MRKNKLQFLAASAASAWIGLPSGCALEQPDERPERASNALDNPTPATGIPGAAGDLVEVGPPGEWGQAFDGATPQQIDALEWVNYFRQSSGLPFVELSAELNAAAQSHADFITRNYSIYEAGLSLHEQAAGNPGFSGVKYWERVAAAGYQGAALSEVISYQPVALASISQWIDSVYHRLPLTHPEAARVGYGAAVNAKTAIGVMEISRLDAPAVNTPVAFPADGATDVPTEWDGNEIPQPPVPPGGYPSGPVFTLQMPGGDELTVSRHRLLREGSEEVPHTMLEPSNDPYLFGAPVVAIYANKPLQPGTRYVVEVEGVYAGAPFAWKSGFSTATTVGCDMIAQDCRNGQGCYALGDEALCAWAGPVPVGGACVFQNDCGAGSTCVQNRCRRVCDAGDATGALACESICQEGFALLSSTGSLGACNPLPCSPLSASCSGSAVCAADAIVGCVLPGSGAVGASCASSADCSVGLGCVGDAASGGICQALCDASPLAGEDINPLGDEAVLPSCAALCPRDGRLHPTFPGLGVCGSN